MSLKYNADFRAKFIFYVLFFGCISAFKSNRTNTKLINKEILKKYIELTDDLFGRFSEKVLNVTKDLEIYNDKTIGRSSLGKYYEEWKPVLEDSEWTMRSRNKNKIQRIRQDRRDSDGRNVKKLGMAMMPLVFHVGASSTWMVITAIMSFKAVALMTLLLVVKIAVAAAKVSSFFTHHYGHKEHTWSVPHQSYSTYEHDAIGHRSFPDVLADSFDRRRTSSQAVASGFQPMTGEHLDPFNPRHGEINIKSEVEDLEDKLSLVKH